MGGTESRPSMHSPIPWPSPPRPSPHLSELSPQDTPNSQLLLKDTDTGVSSHGGDQSGELREDRWKEESGHHVGGAPGH